MVSQYRCSANVTTKADVYNLQISACDERVCSITVTKYLIFISYLLHKATKLYIEHRCSCLNVVLSATDWECVSYPSQFLVSTTYIWLDRSISC